VALGHEIDLLKNRMRRILFDGPVESPKEAFSVIPADPGSKSGTGAGIQEQQEVLDPGARRGNGLKGLLRFRQLSGDDTIREGGERGQGETRRLNNNSSVRFGF
jgi:hypothetical protein